MGNIVKRARPAGPRNHETARAADIVPRQAAGPGMLSSIRPGELTEELRITEQETPPSHQHIQGMFGKIPFRLSLRPGR